MDGTSAVTGFAEPDPPDSQDPALPPPSPTDDLSAEFERLLVQTSQAASNVGIRWEAPEGRFVRLLLTSMQMLNAVALRAEHSFTAAADSAKAVAEAELRKVREVAVAVDQARHHARATIELSRVEQQAALRQIVADSLPGLLEEIRKVVVIREQSWNRDRARANIRAAGVWVLAVFFAGFGLSLWSQWADSSIGARCRNNVVIIDAKPYCALGDPALSPAESRLAP